MMRIQKELLNDSHTKQPFTHPNQEVALTAEKGKVFNVDDDNGDINFSSAEKIVGR